MKMGKIKWEKYFNIKIISLTIWEREHIIELNAKQRLSWESRAFHFSLLKKSFILHVLCYVRGQQ